jgi:hypothetical protein
MAAHDAHSASPDVGRFGAGLTEAEVIRLQVIMRKQCRREVPLAEAWSRAIELLALVEMLLGADDAHMLSTTVRAPSHLTEMRS